MKTAITTLQNDIEWAERYILNNKLSHKQLMLKYNQIDELKKAIKILKASERKENAEHSEQTENKTLHIADVSKQRELLIAFASYLNTYKGMEEIRFDFMVVDFLEKQKGN